MTSECRKYEPAFGLCTFRGKTNKNGNMLRKWLASSSGFFIILLTISLTSLSLSAQKFPGPDWEPQPDPIASPYATVGGEVVVYAGQSPKSLNYYLDTNVFTARVFDTMFETLLTRNSVTLEYEPYIAREWEISDDKKVFTFWLDPDARWSDGRPITAEDVKWTYDTVMNPENLTGPHKVSLGRLQSPEVLGERIIRFTAQKVHWENFSAASSFSIMPKHVFKDRDFNKINFEFPVVSGLYQIGEIKEGIYVSMDRRSDWWRREYPGSKGIGNFQTVKYKFFAERSNGFEAFKKGQIDMFAVYTAQRWVEETTGEKFDKHWIVKQKIYNYNPIGFQGFAMNMRREPFKDARVRKAMAHLVNRRKMNRTMMYNQYFLHKSYFEDLYDEQHPCPNQLVEFDPGKARQLLAEAGWIVNPETGILEKNGWPFRFKFLTRDASTEKYVNVFAEDLKDVGIELEIDKKDWAAWAKDMDSFNYDMTWAAWGAGIFKNPESMWHSSEAQSEGGNNITGFSNARVDALIEKQKTIFDVEQRHAICREIDQIIFNEQPYALLWNINYVRLLYWNKFGMPDTVLSKYGNESTAYWWYDYDLAAELTDAIRNGNALPRKPQIISFDKMFGLPPVKVTSQPPALGLDLSPEAAATEVPKPESEQDEEKKADDAANLPVLAIKILGALIIIVFVVTVMRRTRAGRPL